MNYFDPFQLLEIQDRDIPNLDSKTVEKAKKSFLAEIESTGEHLFRISGYKLDQSAILKVFDDLTDPVKRSFHIRIHQKKPLLKFLLYGSLAYFKEPQDTEMSNDAAFVDFISPYFAFQYDRLLGRGVQERNLQALAPMVEHTPQVNKEYLPKCYHTASQWIADKSEEFEAWAADIDQQLIHHPAEKIVTKVLTALDAEVLNLLPAYFQPARNKAALAVSKLALALYDKNLQTPFSARLLDHALELHPDEAVKRSIREEHSESRKAKSPAALSHAYTQLPEQLSELMQQTEQKKIAPDAVLFRLNSLFSIPELNALPAQYQPLRDATAVQISNLAITVWNEWEDLDAARTIIQYAQQIIVAGEEDQQQIHSTYKDLERLSRKLLQHHESQIEKAIEILQQLRLQLLPAGGKRTEGAIKPTQASEKLDAVFTPVFIDFLLSTKALQQRFTLFEQTLPVLRLLHPQAPVYVNSLLNRLDIVAGQDAKLSNLLYEFRQSLVQEVNKRRKREQTLFRQSLLTGLAVIGIIAALGFVVVHYDLFNAFLSLRKDHTSNFTPAAAVPDSSHYEIVPMPTGEMVECLTIQQFADTTSQSDLKIIASPTRDMVVKLVDKKTDKPIRYVYINSGEEYFINQIPAGEYYLRVAYGSHWNRPKNKPDCEGKFVGVFGFEEPEHTFSFEPEGQQRTFHHSMSFNHDLHNDSSQVVRSKKIQEDEFYKK